MRRVFARAISREHGLADPGRSLRKEVAWSAGTHVQESLFAVFFSVICVITMTHLIGLIITSMIRLQDGKREVTAQEADMREYLRQHEVSYDLQDRIWQVLREVQGDAHRTKEENVDLIKQLPNSLEIELRAE
ncbi:unnamed protein product, partial [Prorocentrum cordatum]